MNMAELTLTRACHLGFLTLISAWMVNAGDVMLKIQNYNLTTVNITCQYDGTQKVSNINIFKDRVRYLSYENGQCHYIKKSNLVCQGQAVNGVSIWFLIDAPDKCQEETQIQCQVRNGEELHREDQGINISAMGDEPEITVNNGSEVQSICEAVPIVCKFPKVCSKEDIHIVSQEGVHIGPVKVHHEKDGDRFSTIASTTGIFLNSSRYTLTCRSRNGKSFHTITGFVKSHDGKTAPTKDNQRGGPTHSASMGTKVGTPIAALLILIGAFTIYKWRCWHPNGENDERNEQGANDG